MMMPTRSLLDSLGGWANLFQGLGSAAVGGVVAALTAIFVVWLTHNGDRRLATDLDARASARALVASVGQIAGEVEQAIHRVTFHDRSQLESLFLRFVVEMEAHQPAIAMVDQAFWDGEINRRIKVVSDQFSRLTGRDGTPLPATVEDGQQLGDTLGTGMGELITALRKWQLSRATSGKRRRRLRKAG
ncbi:hypothetical protein EV644_13268 [Kribbella orskensis]|uniref:Uncharacterized protein n=1 Tax=Kribbella orskensis TaxID=2512216 RepID=A0ABY2B7Y0_9ACTN|nr:MULTISPECIES: hypothetical protein [Kribbella]TCN30604.1 hypothetical protein EV642_13468 [Kribbella sp. VKM Ac-2500]TCO11337.1 hypothetical protein EV644_13268 [Kribbella orskensis]